MVTRRAVLGLPFALAAGETPVPRRLWAGAATAHLGMPDPSGRFLSLVDPDTGNLALRETGTGKIRCLTAKPTDSHEFAYFSAISRDSRKVAYAWHNDAGYYELRVISTEGGPAATLVSNEERPFVQPCAWSPDGGRILTLFFGNDNTSQIAWVDAAGGAVRVLRSLDWIYPNKMSLSPDGKLIAYDDTGTGGGPERDILILAADGSSNTRFIKGPAHDVFPLWTPDGSGLTFLSDRDGMTALYFQPLNGEARLLARDIGRALPLGISNPGDYYYALRSGSIDVYVAPFDGTPADARPIVGIPGGVTLRPELSADGKMLVVVSHSGNENFGRDSRMLTLIDMDSGKARVVAPRLTWIDYARFSPDARQLLVGGSDRHGRSGLFVVDVETAAVAPLVFESAGRIEGFEGVWSVDGKSVLYLRSRELRRLDLGTKEEAVLYSGGGQLHSLAISREGTIAFVDRNDEGESVRLLEPARVIATVHNGMLKGLEWLPGGSALIATVPSDPPSVYRIDTSGSKPVKLDWPVHPNGPVRIQAGTRRIAYSAGKTDMEVWVIEHAVTAGDKSRPAQ